MKKNVCIFYSWSIWFQRKNKSSYELKHSLKTLSMQPWRKKKNEFPINWKEDSFAIKGNRTVSIWTSPYLQRKKKREGSGEARRRDDNIQRRRGKVLYLKGFRGCWGKQNASEANPIMRSRWGMEGYILAVNAFNMAVKTLSCNFCRTSCRRPSWRL